MNEERELLELAWGVIANASDWDRDAEREDVLGWVPAAERWRDRYHAWLTANGIPAGEEESA